MKEWHNDFADTERQGPSGSLALAALQDLVNGWFDEYRPQYQEYHTAKGGGGSTNAKWIRPPFGKPFVITALQ